MRPRTQASVAVTADGEHWVVVGASPDLRQQISETPALWPRQAPRHSPIASLVLLNGDIDGIAGLLSLRENSPFRVIAAPRILEALRANPVFGVLAPSLVSHVAVAPGEPFICGCGVSLTLLAMPGKVPLYLEDRAAAQPEAGPNYAALIAGTEARILVAPACAEFTPAVDEALRQADVIFFDGTLFADEEMIAAGVGQKTGRRMGHVSMSGPDGSLAHLAGLGARRVFIHINNTNPALIEGSPERIAVESAGCEIGYDGMEVRL